MTTRTCPDWPRLMEIAPDLQFKHYSALEAKLPSEALAKVSDVQMGDVELCADLDHNVFFAEHTDPRLTEALRGTHWFELQEWSTTGPGTAFRA